jgi:outer membrane protein assembly factor BamB
VITSNGWEVEGGKFIKLPSPDAPSFIAVEKKTGKLKWSDASPGKNIMEGQWTSPAFAIPRGGKPQVLFPGGDGWLYSFEAASGKLIWKFNGNPKDAQFNHKTPRLTDKAYFMATPVVYEDRVYIGVGCNPAEGPGHGPGVGHLWCIDITKKGDVSPRDDKFDPKDPRNKDSALVWHFGGFIDPKPDKGREYYFGRTMSTCAVHDGLVYVGELDGYVYCIDARSGKKYWEVDTQASMWASPYWVDGKVFIGNDDGVLHVFAHGKSAKSLAKIEIGAGIKTPIKVADGVVYVLTDDYLYAFGKK